MSEPITPLTERQQAMCLECGAVRWARRHHLGRGSRSMRCVGCDRSTTHAVVNWDGTDVRELANRKRSRVDAELSLQHAALLDLMACCRISVVTGRADSSSSDGLPQGGLVEVVRWSQPEEYQVRLLPDLSLADQVYCLDWAWKSLRPVVAEWDRCLVETDAANRPFRRIYNNELERGLYRLS